MESLLIDFDNIIRHSNLALLNAKIKPFPESNQSTGIILAITKSEFDSLEKVPAGESRVKYMNTKRFVDSIRGYAYIIYDKQRKICEITGVNGSVLPQIMDSLLTYIPNNVTLWVGIDTSDPNQHILAKEYCKSGFHDPHICKSSPLGYPFKEYGLCLIKENNTYSSNAMNDVKYVIKEFSKTISNNCMLTACLGKDTIKFLSKLSKSGSTINKDGNITQKEIAGKLFVSSTNSKITQILDVDHQSIITGEEEGVNVVKGLYNFHSHPYEAYKRHNVNLAWPSCQDYIGFLLSSVLYDTILHIVIGIEGFYVISLTKEWTSRKDDITKEVEKFIVDNYDHFYKKGETPSGYTRKVNSISYKGFPIFNVQFIDWNNSSDSFKVYYRKKGVNCFATDKTLQKYKELYL